jgi:hypothetical protein
MYFKHKSETRNGRYPHTVYGNSKHLAVPIILFCIVCEAPVATSLLFVLSCGLDTKRIAERRWGYVWPS